MKLLIAESSPNVLGATDNALQQNKINGSNDVCNNSKADDNSDDTLEQDNCENTKKSDEPSTEPEVTPTVTKISVKSLKSMTTDDSDIQDIEADKVESADSQKSLPSSEVEVLGEEPEATKNSAEEPQLESSDEPNLKSSDETNLKSGEEPNLESSEEPKVESSDEPKVVSSEEPKVVSSEEPKVVSSEEPNLESDEPKAKSSDEPKAESSEEPKTKSSEEPSKPETSEEPKTKSSDESKPESSEELAKPESSEELATPESSEEPAKPESSDPKPINEKQSDDLEVIITSPDEPAPPILENGTEIEVLDPKKEPESQDHAIESNIEEASPQIVNNADQESEEIASSVQAIDIPKTSKDESSKTSETAITEKPISPAIAEKPETEVPADLNTSDPIIIDSEIPKNDATIASKRKLSSPESDEAPKKIICTESEIIKNDDAIEIIDDPDDASKKLVVKNNILKALLAEPSRQKNNEIIDIDDDNTVDSMSSGISQNNDSQGHSDNDKIKVEKEIGEKENLEDSKVRRARRTRSEGHLATGRNMIHYL